MKKSIKVFWISFAVYSSLLFIGMLVVDLNKGNFHFLGQVLRIVPLMKYYAFIGLVFCAVSFLVMWRSHRHYHKELNRQKDKYIELQAKMYALRGKKEDSKPKSVQENSPKQ